MRLQTVQTENGTIQGEVCNNPRIMQFKGIPYAKAPVGELRWKGPQPLEHWDGVRKATEFAPIAYQTPPGSDPNGFYTPEFNPCDRDLPMSEDCLYLNVWTPATSQRDKLPVYVFIHGGGLESNFSYSMDMDGEQMAKQGIVFVTIAYRLNVFGFLSIDETEIDDDSGCGANFGLYDCVAALKWIQRNISAFGGDPEKVTIGGQSAGAFCTLAMFTSPLTKGLFSGVITQSGGGLRAFGYQRRCMTKQESVIEGKKFLRMLHAESIEEARKMPTDQVYRAYLAYRQSGCKMDAVIDNQLLYEDPTDTFLRGAQPDVPYLLGSNAGEMPGTPAAPELPQSLDDYENIIKGILGEKAETFFERWPAKDLQEAQSIYQQDAFNTRTLAAYAYAIDQAKKGRSCYLYRFNADMPGEDHPGAYHGSELWYTFNSLNHCWRPFRGQHYDMARQISGYWVNFVKTGNPNGKDAIGDELPHWEAFSQDSAAIMCFEDEAKCTELELDDMMAFRIKKHLGEI